MSTHRYKGPHYYKGLDTDTSNHVAVEVSMRELAEKIEDLNYGTHRLLSHLIDVRRERLAARIKTYRDRGDEDVAQYAERQGDELADAFERLLNEDFF